MKDELGGKTMIEYAALRAKIYVYRKLHKKLEDKRCKGTNKCIVTKSLTLYDIKTICRESMLFENKKHKVCTVNSHVSTGNFTFDDCKTCLFDGKAIYRKQMFGNKKTRRTR